MIICICNNLNTQKVEQAIQDGAQTPSCVQAQHGCRFNCGQCLAEISERIKQRQSGTFAADVVRAAE